MIESSLVEAGPITCDGGRCRTKRSGRKLTCVRSLRGSFVGVANNTASFPLALLSLFLIPVTLLIENPMNDMPVIVEGVRSKDERDYTGLKNKRDTLASEDVRKTNPSALQSIPPPSSASDPLTPHL
ncbi:hypothetical protein TNCV_4197781 [Trichonephila clavipes]|nr:hypothetical protein TNCV_4197781 [Trichonephila clavipes]